MRLFVALAPPPAALDELSAALIPVREAASPGLRWTPREQWHLTLAFLGEVDAERVPAVREACAVAVQEPGAAPLQLSGAGRFGDRVLWAGLDGDRAALVDLAARLVAALRAAGVDTEERPYRPHLTIARTPRGVSVDLRPAVDALAGFVGRRWQPDAVRLVHSRLGAGPARHALHEEVARWPLAVKPGP